MEDGPSCGKGLAEHSVIASTVGALLASLADNLDAHLPTINVEAESGLVEHAAYASLVDRFREISRLIAAASADMAGYIDLPMAPHHEEAFSNPRITSAFGRYVALESDLMKLLRESHERDREMLESMQKQG